MKYLQRLVSSARNPGGGIHPLVEPPYAPPRSESAPRLLEEEIIVASPIEQRQPPVSDSAAVPAERAERAPFESRPQAPERFYIPLIEETSVSSRAVLPPAPLPTAAIAGDELRARDSGPIPAPTAQRSEPLTAQPPRAASPAAARSISATEPQAPVSRVLEQIPHNSKLTLQPRAAAPKPSRETDEIQIHIGRIEVTAVPPPVARPPAKPTPKAPSLAEYLKRGRNR